MIVNIVFLSLTFAFIIYCAWSALRKFIGYNPDAPSLWQRIKPKLQAFIARHNIDEDAYSEDHAKRRYPTLDEVNERRIGEGHRLPKNNSKIPMPRVNPPRREDL